MKKIVALFVGCIFVATFWYGEKTKQISEYGMVFYGMGLSCDDECGQDKQLKYFQRAVRYNPKSSDAYYNDKLSDAHYRSALIYEKKGNQGKALESFTKAIEINQNARAYYKMGLYYFREEAYERAVRYFQQSYKDEINRPDDTLYYMARAYDKQGKYKMAVARYQGFIEDHMEYALEVCPRIVEIYYLLNDTDSISHRLRELRSERRGRGDLADQLEQVFKMVQDSM